MATQGIPLAGPAPDLPAPRKRRIDITRPVDMPEVDTSIGSDPSLYGPPDSPTISTFATRPAKAKGLLQKGVTALLTQAGKPPQ